MSWRGRRFVGPRALAAAGVLVVATGCGGDPMDVNACSFTPMQRALDVAPVGARVFVCAGVHREALTITKNVTLYGASAEETVLTGMGAAAVIAVHGVEGPTSIAAMTLQPEAGARETRTGLAVAESEGVTLTGLTIDLGALDPGASPPGGDDGAGAEAASESGAAGEGGLQEAGPGAEGGQPAGLWGIEVASSQVTVEGGAVRHVGRVEIEAASLWVHAISRVSLGQMTLQTSSGPGLSTSDSTVSMSDSTIEDTNRGIEVLSGTVQVTGTTISGARTDGLSVLDGELHGDGLTIDSPQRYGALLSGGLADLSRTQMLQPTDGVHVLLGTALATDCSVSGARESGIYVGDSGLVSWSGGSLSGCAQGILLAFASGEVSLQDTTIDGSLGRGIEIHAGDLIARGGSITHSGAEGIFADGGSILADGTLVDTSGGDGVGLTGSANAVLGNVTIRGSAGWGLSCDGGAQDGGMSSVALSSCIGYFDGNARGDAHLVNGCEVLYQCIDLGP